MGVPGTEDSSGTVGSGEANLCGVGCCAAASFFSDRQAGVPAPPFLLSRSDRPTRNNTPTTQACKWLPSHFLSVPLSAPT